MLTRTSLYRRMNSVAESPHRIPSLRLGSQRSKGEAHPKEETNQGLTGCCHRVTQQAITWISRSEGICDAVRLPACFRASVRTGPALLFVSSGQEKRKDRVNRRWRGTVREKRQGWREIRWLLESPPQTTHQRKTASAHLSACEWAFQLAAQRYLVINWISRECRHRGRLQSCWATPQTTEIVILWMHSCCTRVCGSRLVLNYSSQRQSMSRFTEKNLSNYYTLITSKEMVEFCIHVYLNLTSC